MEQDHEPVPEPRGDQGEPPRHPPTALATGTPEPEPLRRREPWRGGARPAGLPPGLRHALDRVFDALDAAADAVRESARRLVH